MQEHDKNILTLDQEQVELFNLVKFICNKIAAIVRVFPDTQDGIELLIEGYKVDAKDYIEIYAEDGSSVHISDHGTGSRMYCMGRYEEDFNMIQYEKCVDFDGSQTPQDIVSFKFIANHDPKIFIPLFTVAKIWIKLFKHVYLKSILTYKGKCNMSTKRRKIVM